MSSVDNRVVRMEFDNATFKQKAKETKAALGDVNGAIDAAGKSKGLFSMSRAMDSVQVSASKMGVVATTAIATVANKAVNAGLQLANSLTLGPIRAGFAEYESLMSKQNVIMNATGASGKEVKKVLTELNAYSDQTIYSFGDMTESITKFVNAGVPLGTSVESIKGIANAAAFAGANSNEAGRAMYAFSQAMSTGYMGLQDWNQVESANMGTVKFKNELLKAGVAAGTLTKRGKEYVMANGKTVTATKGWRDGLQEQWLTTDALNKALAKYADNTKGIGKEAYRTATEVKNFSMFMDTLKEGMGSSWAAIFGSFMGGMKQSTRTWTAVSTAVGGVVNNFTNFMTTMGNTWRRMGGLETVGNTVKNVLAPIVAIFEALGEAWQAAFPPETNAKSPGKTLYAITRGMELLTQPLQGLASLIRGSVPVLTVFFQVIKAGGGIVIEFGKWIAQILGALFGLVNFKAVGGGVMSFLQRVGDMASAAGRKISELLSSVGGMAGSIGGALGGISMPKLNMPSMPDFKMPSFGGEEKASSGGGGEQKNISGIAALASTATPQVRAFGDEVERISGFRFNPDAVLDPSRVRNAGEEFENTGTQVKDLGDELGISFDGVMSVVRDFGGWLADFFGAINVDDIISSLNLAMLATFVFSMRNMFGAFSDMAGGVGQMANGIGGIASTIGGLGDTLGDFAKAQSRLATAAVIKQVAIAIAIMVVSLWILSKIPAEEISRGLLAMGVMMTMMVLAMHGMVSAAERLDGLKIAGQFMALSVAMLAIGGAMLLLSGAFFIFQFISWKDIAKGLSVMATMLLGMAVMGKLAQGAGGAILAASATFLSIAITITILAGALMLFSFVKWSNMEKAGAVLGAIALSIGLLALLPAANLAAAALAMITLASSMSIMAVALIGFAAVEWESIKKAAVVIGLLTASMWLLAPIAASAVPTLLTMAGALVGIAIAGKILNEVDWESIKKVAVILGLLVVTFAIFMGILYLSQSVIALLTGLALGMAALAGAIALLTLAFALILPLLAASGAVFLAFATAAALAFVVFMQTLAAEAPLLKTAFLNILQELINTIVAAVPMVIRGIKDLWNAVKAEFTSKDKNTLMGDAGESWIDKLKNGIKNKIKDIVKAAVELAKDFISGLVSKAKEIGAAAATLVARLIDGIGSKIGGVVDAAVNLVVNFIGALSARVGDLVQAGFDFIIAFFDGVANAIETNTGPLVESMLGVGKALVMGLGDGIKALASKPIEWIKDIVGKLPWWAKKLLKIKSPSRVFMEIGKFLVQGLTNGIQSNAASAITAVASMVSGQIATASSYISKFVQKLEQQAIAARSQADGLAAAAERAAAAAEKTKSRKDDRAADKLGRKAEAADRAAERAETKAEKAEAKADREGLFQQSSLIDKAKMRSEDAQASIEDAKQYQQDAATKLTQAKALEKEAAKKIYNKKERAAMRKEADALRKSAANDAKMANNSINTARNQATSALYWQKQAGAEAATAFQNAFDADAKAAADQDAFEAMTVEERANLRRKQADELDAKAQKALKDAKNLAYTDIEQANKLAEDAMAAAQQARQYRDEADNLTANPGVGSGTLLNLEASTAAAAAYQNYTGSYDSSLGAAAGGIQFNQYNTSPTALDDIEIYRQTNNFVNYAVGRLVPA